MNAEWNVNKQSEMSEETNLRNTCRQLEQEYVDWGRKATHGGFRLVREWPAIGELGRYTVNGVRVRFVTTRKRSIQVQTPEGKTVAECAMKPGLARDLYPIAGETAKL
jgi:hypothetical protein